MQRLKTYLVVAHLTGWLLFMAFPLLFLNGGNGQSGEWIQIISLTSYWVFCFTYIFLFYLNGWLLIPKLFFRKKYYVYSLTVIVLLSGVYLLKPYDRLRRSSEQRTNIQKPQQSLPGGPPGGEFGPPPGEDHPPGPPPGDSPARHRPPGGRPRLWLHHPQGPGPGNQPHGGRHAFFDSISIFIFLMIMALSAASRIIRQWQLTEQRAARAEADKVSAELSFLKAQINPHFLFNTLNNIYTLALMKDENAPESIMKLSNIMRYVTDDAGKDFVALQDELNCIGDYLELQRLRLGEKTTVNYLAVGNTDGKKIAPLILMTFVENLFKYGVSKQKASKIVINVVVSDVSILFSCSNPVFHENKDKERSGIGLKNTCMRLERLYPGKHTLEINAQNSSYTVKLILKN